MAYSIATLKQKQNSRFSSVFTSEDKINRPELGQSKTDNIPRLTVHQEGVAKLLRNLNPHKATGPDEISAQLKTTAKRKRKTTR